MRVVRVHGARRTLREALLHMQESGRENQRGRDALGAPCDHPQFVVLKEGEDEGTAPLDEEPEDEQAEAALIDEASHEWSRQNLHEGLGGEQRTRSELSSV